MDLNVKSESNTAAKDSVTTEQRLYKIKLVLKDKQPVGPQIQLPEKYRPCKPFCVWEVECRQNLMNFASNRSTWVPDTLFSRESLKKLRL